MKYFYKLLFVFFVFSFFSCDKKEVSFSENGFQYVLSITQSSINRDSSISIVFTEDITNTNEVSNAGKFLPAQKGSWTQESENSITFTPEAFFKSNDSFDLSLDVGRLFNKGTKKIGFVRSFNVKPASFNVSLKDLKADDAKTYTLEGVVETDINCNSDDITSFLTAKIDDKDCKVIFAKNDTTKNHTFKISGINRGEKQQSLEVLYDANKLGFNIKGQISKEIPALGSFDIISVKAINDRSVRFTFSEDLDPTVDLSGFINVIAENVNFTYRWTFDRNILTVICSQDSFPTGALISIYPNFKSKTGNVLKKGYEHKVVSGWEKPEIKFADSGVILPNEGKPIVAIFTKNISGIIVEAVKIQKTNILQFLQVNSLDESDEMYRVGESVWKKDFDFEWKPEMKNNFVVRGLDLSELVKKYPDGMFRLRITFAHRHSKYENNTNHVDPKLEFPDDFVNFANDPFNAYWEKIENKEYRRNFWNSDDNPNHPAFYIATYNRNILREKNILVSNLALSAKVDNKGDAYIQAVNLLTSRPEKNTELKLYNFTQGLLEEGTCDSNGLYKTKSKDFVFVQAKSGNNYSYLSFRNAPLSTSNFKVDGVNTSDGIKGFIYGERGVWRPADKMHLCLIIQDTQNTLPENLPVIFTLEDPMGRVTDKQVLNENISGFYKVETQTDKTSPTGTWTARFKIGNNVWRKRVKVESVIPNKLSVNLKVSNDYFSSGQNNISLESEWLTGVKASGLKAEIYSRYISKNTGWDDYKEYTFNNLQYYTSTTQEKIWSGVLDENGKTNFQLKLDSGKNVSGMLNAIMETRVYESSGAYSIETKRFDYSPFSRYVGFKLPKSDDDYREVLYTGKTHSAEIVLVDEKGNLVKDTAKVEFSIYRLDWLWWWVRDAYTKASYDENRSAKHITTKSVNLKNGKATVDFKLDEWGRYLFIVSDPNGGHSASFISYVDYSYWSTRGNTDVEGSSSMLFLTSNKDKYNIDENASITFNSNEEATAYITIEKNGTILKQEVVETVAGTNMYTFKTDSTMAPNVYVHISLVQKYAQTTNSLPIRLYGIIPIMIEDKTTRLFPVIKTTSSFTPNGNCEIKISEKNGRVATFTLAVVDEGLLGLTAFKTPNPWDYFYSKESSQLKSYDIFNYVSGAINGELQTLITVGGSDVNELISSKSAERFKPVVFYFGPYKLEKGETKTLNFTMPEYIGEVRLMAVIASDKAYGIAEEKVKVKSDVMLSPTLPRTLGVNEVVNIPVTIFNTTNKSKNVSISMQAKGIKEIFDSKTIRLEPASNQTIQFKMQTEKAGTTQITFVAKDGMRELCRSTNEIATVSRGINYSTEKIISLKPNETFEQAFETKGESGSKSMSIEISKNQIIGIEKHLDYLLSFPHGCIEQITSKAFAQLYLDKLLFLDKNTSENIKNNINTVIESYPKYQLSNGGFTYWQGGEYEHIWASSYVLHFLIEAKRAGYYVETKIYESLVQRLKNISNSFSSDYVYDLNAQSYRLYVLSLIGEGNFGAMNRLLNVKKLSPYAKAFLALAYATSGSQEQGQKIFSEIETDFPSYRKTGDDFSSSIRDLAITCLVAKKINHTSADSRFMALSKIANSTSWLSTQEIAWLLIATSSFYTKAEGGSVKYEVDVSNNKIKNILTENSQIHSLILEDAEKQNVKIKNIGNTVFFASVRYKSKISSGYENLQSKGLNLNVRYFRDGKEIQAEQINHGDNFSLYLAVKNETLTKLDNLVLTIPIPTAWEVSNERLGGNVSTENYSYLDMRDEVIYIHFDLEKSETKGFNFNCTSAYRGSYFVPAIYCEAMYDAEIKANNVGTKVENN